MSPVVDQYNFDFQPYQRDGESNFNSVNPKALKAYLMPLEII